ncbi:hypothetical protein BGZ80_003848 [Entomortierella chlamydospora]|uniref:Fungal lipase-type domain-containing protein n=1 Tax=Entomortierella chlamydospora TaxID=101097 RepID=A0A9P6MNS0_9FUNG|nr:hypothetical protein BGZ80_003848 [Entomortierella chlamydospora]
MLMSPPLNFFLVFALDFDVPLISTFRLISVVSLLPLIFSLDVPARESIHLTYIKRLPLSARRTTTDLPSRFKILFTKLPRTVTSTITNSYTNSSQTVLKTIKRTLTRTVTRAATQTNSIAEPSPQTLYRTLTGTHKKACNPTFLPVASGGDGNDVQYWYVGYDPSLNTVVVSYQGTSVEKLMSELTDGDLMFSSLDSALFPGLSSNIEVCSKFHDMFTKSATDVLSAVHTAMSEHSTSSVTVVGHSLGGALATLAAVYLPLWLHSGTTFQAITFGQPRIGNQAFADYIDANFPATHINNKKDPIPIVPGRFLGYVSSSGEVHIGETDEWTTCPGQDNHSPKCSTGDVPEIFDGNEDDNIGPYNGIEMGC